MKWVGSYQTASYSEQIAAYCFTGFPLFHVTHPVSREIFSRTWSVQRLGPLKTRQFIECQQCRQHNTLHCCSSQERLWTRLRLSLPLWREAVNSFSLSHHLVSRSLPPVLIGKIPAFLFSIWMHRFIKALIVCMNTTETNCSLLQSMAFVLKTIVFFPVDL